MLFMSITVQCRAARLSAIPPPCRALSLHLSAVLRCQELGWRLGAPTSPPREHREVRGVGKGTVGSAKTLEMLPPVSTLPIPLANTPQGQTARREATGPFLIFYFLFLELGRNWANINRRSWGGMGSGVPRRQSPAGSGRQDEVWDSERGSQHP